MRACLVSVALGLAAVSCRCQDPPGGGQPASSTAASSSAQAPLARSAPQPAARTPPSAQGLALAGSRLHAVIVGVLRFDSASVAGWSADKRKDQELHDLLQARGVPATQLHLLLDERATGDAIFGALERAAEQVPEDGTLLFYYAGHGARDAQGEPYFLPYDTLRSATGVPIAELSRRLQKHFRGRRLALMADCCYSGTLKQIVDDFEPRPSVQAFSLTSADASNLSTNNWTFTQTVLDALSGDGFMDANRDGRVTLAEANASVRDEMKYRERQRHGFHSLRLSAELPLAKVRARRPDGVSSAHALGDWVRAPRAGGLEVGQVRAERGGERQVRFYDYNQPAEHWYPVAQLAAVTFSTYPPGAKLQVFWGGKRWPANVLRRDGDFHLITYPGWPAYWDEWVMSDRIVEPGPTGASPAKGSAVEVEWRGKWWPAVVLERAGQRTKIHYEGYDSSWDEWVTPDRIRPPTDKPAR